ncbi:hypothetical protein NP493_1298g00025 [Ridgeia piscesae]|uniref:Reverse transcriptase domain-containing protein n=1 Tax=Ridgeia piscesae TaxID=27915 RepID=A0AAD9NH32_RIDPI|nr:hypothetical protein NP493_1298g00025 [Ridgeia piscesae]
MFSLITLQRISDNVDDFLSPSKSGFRRGRSTADVIWGHRWLVAKCQRYKDVIEMLGIDLSRAFDTIRREKLLSVLHSFLDTDNAQIIRLLLSETNIIVRVDDVEHKSWHSTRGFTIASTRHSVPRSSPSNFARMCPTPTTIRH